MQQENVRITKVEKSEERNVKHKSYLILLKYIPHIASLMYIVYTIFQFLDVDLIILGYFINISITSWIFMMLSSIVFRFCYVHRLPLYYILINELTTVIDTYIGIPITEMNLLGVHLIFIGLLVFGYTFYYFKNMARSVV